MAALIVLDNGFLVGEWTDQELPRVREWIWIEEAKLLFVVTAIIRVVVDVSDGGTSPTPYHQSRTRIFVNRVSIDDTEFAIPLGRLKVQGL